MRRRVISSLVLPLAVTGGCARSGPPVLLPAVVSPAVVAPPPGRGLVAGIGRADITPPPGLGLAGNGSEGRRAAGYRHRLYVRALVLEDRRGERIALVVADLPFVSALIQRRAAALLDPRTGIGADRLIVAATHTHAGPGHAEDGRLYNRIGSSVSGYDSAFVRVLAVAIARAVSQACDTLRSARVRWGTTPVWGVTRNRSLPAYLRNPPYPITPPPGLDSAQASVDPTLTMVRVDFRRPGDSVFRPAGALSVFAIHATGNAPDNDLYDGDIHALVERALERHIDSLAGPAAGGSVHLFASGAEGDVSPMWDRESRCQRPRARPTPVYAGGRAIRAWEWLAPSVTSRKRCLAASRRDIALVGGAIARHAAALFDSLAPDSAGGEVLVARAARTLPLAGPGAPAELCSDPGVGRSMIAGADDAPSRYRSWRWLGLLPSGFEEGGRAARNPPSGCQAEKRPALTGLLHWALVGPHAYPEAAQLFVVRIGGLLIASIPAEATTTAGRQMTEAVRTAAAESGAPVDHVVLLGLANGFMQYVVTEAEYRLQHYEGGATLYGPATARVLARELAALARAMGGPTPASPPTDLGLMTIYPGAPHKILPRPRAGDPPPIARRILRFECSRRAVIAEWSDAAPGGLLPTDQPLLRFLRAGEDGTEPEVVAWDDGPDTEIRVLRAIGHGAWRWQVRWRPPLAGRYRLLLAERPGVSALATSECAAGGPSP